MSAGVDTIAEDVALVRRLRRTGPARAVVVGSVALLLSVAAFGWTLAIGEYPMSIPDVVLALAGRGPLEYQYVINELRLPRAVVAILVGAAFGMAGALFQALARNPLASPDIIGISAGASAAAVAGIVLTGAGGPTVSAYAFAGALGAAVLIYLLAYRGGTSGYRLVLVGIGVGAFLSAATAYLLVKASDDELQRANVWLTGSLTGREWQHVPALAVGTALLLPAAMLLWRPLGIVQLGDDTARALGSRLESVRGLLILIGVGLTAVATAAAGPVSFVAFVSPAIARRLVGKPLTLLPSALVGGLLVLVADLIGRAGTIGIPMPVGVVTGIIGAPYLLYLLARANRIGALG